LDRLGVLVLAAVTVAAVGNRVGRATVSRRGIGRGRSCASVLVVVCHWICSVELAETVCGNRNGDEEAKESAQKTKGVLLVVLVAPPTMAFCL
jgi:hypothetical protein